MSRADGQAADANDALRTRRRVLLKALAFGVPAALLASAVPTALLPPSPKGSGRLSLESVTASTFSGRVGEKFSVRAGAFNGVDVELREVVRLSEKFAGPPGADSFSIVFRGPADRRLGQDTYGFEHGEMGQFPLFIVPLAPRADGQYYEAVFSRI